MALLEQQPIRGLYALMSILGTFAAIPWYVLKSVMPAARPHESWTFYQAVMSPIVRSFLWHQANLRVRTPLSFAPGTLGDRLEKIAAADSSFYTGILASKEEIKPVTIPAVWYPDINSRSPSKDQPVILHIHGGCFVTLDARPDVSAFAAKSLSQISPRVLMISYRLSSNPGGIFPAALQDALTAYMFLLNHEGSGRNIVLSGDSAGANIALGLLRYIYSDEGVALRIKPPGAALLWSPWLDIAKVHRNSNSVDQHPNASKDFMNSEMAGWGASTIGSAEDVQSPYLTSLGHPFPAAETPIWYQCGGAEIWYSEAVKSFEQMQAIQSNKVELHVEEEATHDILYAGQVTGFARNTTRSALNAKGFLKRVL